MSRAFISYAREDQEAAGRLAAVLTETGWEVWWDLHLAAGEMYDEEIQRRLHDADAVLVLWSQASIVSRWVKAEADVGWDRDVLVPVRLDDSAIPLPFHRVQTADLTGWHGLADHPGLAEVRAALARIEGADSPPPAPPAVRPPAHSSRLHRTLLLGGGAVVIAVVAAISALIAFGGDRDESVSTLPGGDPITVPDVVGMRLDEARLQLTVIGLEGPGLRTVDGGFFSDDADLETVTRVVDVSPPPGSTGPRGAIDVTLFIEYCNGSCTPGTAPPGG